MSSTLTDRINAAGSGAAPREFKDFIHDYGADPTGVEPCDDAWDLAVADGGRIFVPEGIYKFDANKTVEDTNALIFEGESNGPGSGSTGVIFRFTTTTGDCITFDNCQGSGLRNITFAPTVRRTAGWDVKFTGGCFDCFMSDCRHDFGYNAVWVHHATEFNLHNPTFRYLYGNEPFLYGRGATAAESCYRCVVVNLQADNPYANAVEAAQVSTHSDTTAYALGDIVQVNDKLWECTTAGTSGTGTSPSTPGGTTAAEGFSTEVIDGTVGWTFRGHDELTWVTMDSYGYSLIIDKAACINGWLGLYMRDTIGAASDASIPKFLWLYGFEADHNYLYGILLNEGQNAYIVNAWVSSALDGNGIVIADDFMGDAQFIGGRVFGCAENGVLIGSGPVNWLLDGMTVTANSQKQSNTYRGIVTGANATGGIITGCSTLRTDGGTNPQQYGLFMNTGIDNCVITGNDFRGNTTGATTGGSLTETLIIKDNVGGTDLVAGPEWEVQKGSDQIGIGTSFVDIADLTFPIATANARYAFEFWILADADATTTGIDVSVNGPSTPTSLTYTVEYWTAAATKAHAAFVAYDGDTASTDSNGTDRRLFKVEGILVNGSNTGTLAARVKGETGTGVNVRAGSRGRIKRLA
jgi:hypothetical protein